MFRKNIRVLGVSWNVSGRKVSFVPGCSRKSVLKPRDLCLWRKKMLSHMYWTTCLQSLQIYLLYLYVKVILHHQEVHISLFLLKLCDETNLKGTDWYHCHLYWRKQPPIMTHWFVKLGEKKTVKYGECVWVCEVGGWAVWGCVLCVQRQIDIKLLGHHQWEKDINPPKSCRGRRGQTYGSTSWLITSSHSRAGALHGRYDLTLLDISLLIGSCLQPQIPPSPPPPFYVQYFCYCWGGGELVLLEESSINVFLFPFFLSHCLIRCTVVHNIFSLVFGSALSSYSISVLCCIVGNSVHQRHSQTLVHAGSFMYANFLHFFQGDRSKYSKDG